MSATGLAQLFGMMRDGLDTTVFSSVRQVDAYVEELKKEPVNEELTAELFYPVTVKIKGEWLGQNHTDIDLTLRVRDPVLRLRRLIRQHSGTAHPDFKWEPQPRTRLAGGDGAFEHPLQCAWFHHLTAILRATVFANAVVIALVFYSDKSHLSSAGSAKGHPLMMSFVNSTFELRCAILEDNIIAMFPDKPEKPQGVSDDVWHTAWTKAHNQCVKTVLNRTGHGAAGGWCGATSRRLGATRRSPGASHSPCPVADDARRGTVLVRHDNWGTAAPRHDCYLPVLPTTTRQKTYMPRAAPPPTSAACRYR
jgi:hypothetical protein